MRISGENLGNTLGSFGKIFLYFILPFTFNNGNGKCDFAQMRITGLIWCEAGLILSK